MNNRPLVVLMGAVSAMLLAAGCAQGIPSSSPSLTSPSNSASSTGVLLPTVTPVGDLLPTPHNAADWDYLRQQVAAARTVAERITALFPQNNPGESPSLDTIEGLHVLSEAEKTEILGIANTFEPFQQALKDPDLIRMDVRDFLWKSFSNDSAVTVSNTLLAERGTSSKLMDYMGPANLPGVFILFHTSHDSYAYAAVKIFVSRAAGKVVYVEASITAAQPPAAGGWDNVNPDSFRLDYHNDTLSPLNPNYDPAGMYGPERTRFGPPWDRVPGLPGAATPTSATPTAAPNESEKIFNQFNYYSTSVNVIWYASGQEVRLTRDDPRYAEFMRVFDYSINAPGGASIAKAGGSEPSTTVPYALGYILTFGLLDGSRVVFNCSSENVWFENRDYIYRRPFSQNLHDFLDDLLSHPDAPALSPISIQPAVGQFLFGDSNSRGIVLKAVAVRPAVLDKDYVDIRPPGTIVKKGESCLLITGQVESQLEQDKYMTMVARGYNSVGEQVAHSLDAGPIYGVISVFLPAKGLDGFIIHLNAAPDVVKIKLDPSDQLYDIPPP